MKACGLVWPWPQNIWFWNEACSTRVGRTGSLRWPGFQPPLCADCSTAPCRVLSPEASVFVVFLLSLPDVVTKYSNFISFPLYLNGRRTNTLQVGPSAAWRSQLVLSWPDGQRRTGRWCHSPWARGSLWMGELCRCRQGPQPPVPWPFALGASRLYSSPFFTVYSALVLSVSTESCNQSILEHFHHSRKRPYPH